MPEIAKLGMLAFCACPNDSLYAKEFLGGWITHDGRDSAIGEGEGEGEC